MYLAAIGRLNATIDTELARRKPDALPPVLDDYAQRYPRLAGLDRVRGDLKAYTELLGDAVARELTPLLALMKHVHFSTPPFEAHYARLAASRLPSADVIQRHDAVTAAWQHGDGLQALARHAMGRDPLDGALYIFINRRGSQIKCLYFDRSGFCIWGKRLESGRFISDWRNVRTREMDWTGLKLLLEGLEGKRVRRRFALPLAATKVL